MHALANRWGLGLVVLTLLTVMPIPFEAHAIGFGVLTGSATYTPSLTAANATRDVDYSLGLADVETRAGLLTLDCRLEGSSGGNLVSDNAYATGNCVDAFAGWSAPCAATMSRIGAFGALAMQCLTPWGPIQFSGPVEFVPLTAPSMGTFALVGQVASS